MAFNFKPKSEEELDKENLLPEGIYSFECMNGIEKKSHSGNDMIEIQLRVFAPDGEAHTVKDYLLANFLKKLFAFAKVTGGLPAYHAGTFGSKDCSGKSGWVKIGIQKGKQKPNAPDGECFPSRNEVKDYVFEPVKAGAAPAASGFANAYAPPPPKPVSTEKLDEDVPF